MMLLERTDALYPRVKQWKIITRRKLAAEVPVLYSSMLLGVCFRQLVPGTGVFLLLLKFEHYNNINKYNNIFFWKC